MRISDTIFYEIVRPTSLPCLFWLAHAATLDEIVSVRESPRDVCQSAMKVQKSEMNDASKDLNDIECIPKSTQDASASYPFHSNHFNDDSRLISPLRLHFVRALERGAHGLIMVVDGNKFAVKCDNANNRKDAMFMPQQGIKTYDFMKKEDIDSMPTLHFHGCAYVLDFVVTDYIDGQSFHWQTDDNNEAILQDYERQLRRFPLCIKT